jgi:selenocysteine lyase/cysteine desulfurase
MTPDDIEVLRTHFPITKRCAYLDHAFVGPLSHDAATAVQRATQEHEHGASLAFEKLIAEADEVRRVFAAFIGADWEEIAIVNTTSMAISIVANGMHWNAGDSVVIPENEYLSNVYPWQQLARRGVQLRRVPCPDGRVTTDRLLTACDKTTRIVAVSWVQFSNGYRADIIGLGEACHARGILLVVDANHAVGALAIDVHNLPIDVLTTQSFKWLLGPYNVAWLYVRRDLVETIEPFAVGPLSAETTTSFLDQTLELRHDAGRFETGVPNLPGILGVGASLRLLSNIGMNAVEKRVLYLSDYLAEGLESRGYRVLTVRTRPDERSGILIFRHRNTEATTLQSHHNTAHTAEAVRSRGLDRRGNDPWHSACLDQLLNDGIVISMREGSLRASPHFYNTEAEIDGLFDALP